jgi:sigma-B regulation protein RsbU (phosphoserine phosphatase)
MAMVKTTIRENLLSGRGLAETLNRVNRELWLSNPEKMLATVFALTLNTESGVLTFANAGHENPLMLGRNPFFQEVRSGMPLGLFENAFITEEKLVLRDGDGIFLYTDGVTEAKHEKQRFGEAGLLSAAVGAPSAKPEQLLPFIRRQIDLFAGQEPQFDDITMMGLQYLGPSEL